MDPCNYCLPAAQAMLCALGNGQNPGRWPKSSVGSFLVLANHTDVLVEMLPYEEKVRLLSDAGLWGLVGETDSRWILDCQQAAGYLGVVFQIMVSGHKVP